MLVDNLNYYSEDALSGEEKTDYKTATIQPFKATIYFNIAVLTYALNILAMKILFERNPGLTSIGMQFLKSVLGSTALIMIANKDLYKYLKVTSED